MTISTFKMVLSSMNRVFAHNLYRNKKLNAIAKGQNASNYIVIASIKENIARKIAIAAIALIQKITSKRETRLSIHSKNAIQMLLSLKYKLKK